jgi:membrane peptidoglycan carboxypeptidase
MADNSGWHDPKTPNLWKPAEPKDKPKEAVWRSVSALPKDLSEEPKTAGGWHLPSPEDTTFTPTDTLTVEESTAAPSALRPEDLIAEIMAQAPRKSEPALRPEDMAMSLTPAVSGLEGLEELGALDDEEAVDPLSMSEFFALRELEAGAADGDDGADVGADDLSPAARLAMMADAERATELLPQVDPAMVAEQRLRELQGGMTDENSTRIMPADDSPEAVAQRALAELMGGGTSATNMATVVPPAPAVPSEQDLLAQQFRDAEQRAVVIRDRYNRGEISQEQANAAQSDLRVFDHARQEWWSFGLDGMKWYRFNALTGGWQEATPPYVARPSAPPTITTQFDPNDVLSGSLPYIPDTRTPAEVSGAGTAGYDPYAVTSPLPNPNQPLYDPNLTVAGASYDVDVLPNAADTLQGLRMVDATMPMNATPAAAYAYDEGQAEAPDYEDAQPLPTFDRYKQQERASFTRVLVIALIALFGLGVLVVAGSAGAALAWYNQQVSEWRDEVSALANYNPRFQTARIMDANGQLIAELNSRDGGARKVIPLTQMSPYLIHAVLSTENKTFYDDPGFDIFAIGRAFLQNLGAGEIQSGASTITQQIARNLILKDTEPTAARKVQEILVAMEIANTYDKNFILQLYMNEFFFGNQSYGVEAASEFYFKKPAADLDMAESAMLAGIISAPAANDPVINKEQAIRAARNSIRLMLETNCLQFQHGEWAQSGQPFCINESVFVPYNGEQAKLVTVNSDGTYGGLLALLLAQVEVRVYRPREAQFKYPHFVNYVQSLVEQQFGTNTMFQRGFTIYTTLNPRIQDAAEDALRRQVAALVNNGVNTGAVMVTEPQTGAIRAMVGSPDFSNEQIAGQVDNTRTWQQSGSAIKAVLYTAALEGGPNGYMTPASILWDVPSSYPIAGSAPYQPTNFRAGTFYGPTRLRIALQNSYNVSAVKAFEFIGVEKFKSTAERMGLNFLPEAVFGLPSALGANEVRLIDMMKAYGTLANSGRYAPLYAIDRITEDAGGVTAEVPLPERPQPTQAVSPQVAFLMQNILSDDNARASEFGRDSALTLTRSGIPTQNFVAAKTGTSDNGRDLWTMGFTSNTVVGVWLGTFDNARTVGVSGFTAAAPVWNTVMTAAVSGRTPTQFANPGGVVQDTICAETGTLAGDTCPTRITDIYIQTQPPPPATQGFVQTLQVDSWTGYLANEWCSENVVARTVANITDPFAVNWLVNTQQGRDFARRIGLPDNLQAPPTVACSQGQALPNIRLNNPLDNSQVQNTLTITGQVSASDLGRFDLEFASANAPTSFTRITTSSQQFPTPNSTLGTWDTTSVPNGSYIVRLVAYSTAGGTIERRATVIVNNVLPTPTPLPLPTATPNFVLPTPFTPLSTPLPFDTTNPTPTATLAP